MADVIDISSRFRKAPPPLKDIVAHCIDDIMSNWERFARNNRLNDFFLESIPSYTDSSASYVSDLNVLAQLEQNVRMSPGVLAPGLNGPAQLGWRVCFKINGELVETPDFISEGYARCCGVLLFLKIKRDLTTHGVTIT